MDLLCSVVSLLLWRMWEKAAKYFPSAGCAPAETAAWGFRVQRAAAVQMQSCAPQQEPCSAQGHCCHGQGTGGHVPHAQHSLDHTQVLCPLWGCPYRKGVDRLEEGKGQWLGLENFPERKGHGEQGSVSLGQAGLWDPTHLAPSCEVIEPSFSQPRWEVTRSQNKVLDDYRENLFPWGHSTAAQLPSKAVPSPSSGVFQTQAVQAQSGLVWPQNWPALSWSLDRELLRAPPAQVVLSFCDSALGCTQESLGHG